MNRSDYIEGLRELADFLARHPELPMPRSPFDANAWVDPDKDAPAAMRAAAKTMGRAEKKVGESWFEVARTFGNGAGKYSLNAARERVCERVVVGTEAVEVPDPDAPLVTEEREVVEWRCEPLLASVQEVA